MQTWFQTLLSNSTCTGTLSREDIHANHPGSSSSPAGGGVAAAILARAAAVVLPMPPLNEYELSRVIDVSVGGAAGGGGGGGGGGRGGGGGGRARSGGRRHASSLEMARLIASKLLPQGATPLYARMIAPIVADICDAQPRGWGAAGDVEVPYAVSSALWRQPNTARGLVGLYMSIPVDQIA